MKQTVAYSCTYQHCGYPVGNLGITAGFPTVCRERDSNPHTFRHTHLKRTLTVDVSNSMGTGRGFFPVHLAPTPAYIFPDPLTIYNIYCILMGKANNTGRHKWIEKS